MSLHTIDAVAYIAPLRIRDRSPDEVVAIALHDACFVGDGYEIGDQLYCVPHDPAETRDGDLVVVRDKDQNYFVRRYRQRGAHTVLEHRMQLAPAKFYFPEDVELLYRVVG